MRLRAPLPNPLNTDRPSSTENEPAHPSREVAGAVLPVDSPVGVGIDMTGEMTGRADATVSPARVLRVLSGPHGGAQVALQAERLLVGNLEHECDIVLDVTVAERHACLLRVGPDGWTVLAIAGDLWVGSEYLPIQHTRNIAPAEVLTLARVSFAVADPSAVDWEAVKPPFELVKPTEPVALPRVALLPRKKDFVQRWTALTMATGASIGAVVLFAGAALLVQNWRQPDTDPAAVTQHLREWQGRLEALPYGRELHAHAGVDHPRRLVVRGYLPRATDLALLEAYLLQAEVEAEIRADFVDTMGAELARRLGARPGEQARYLGKGRFELRSGDSEVGRLEQRARQAMQEMPAVLALHLTLTEADESDVSGPRQLRLERAAEGASDIVVHAPARTIDPAAVAASAAARASLSVREVRPGRLPSVVLANGARYFEGATLPDGRIVRRIEPDRLVLQAGTSTTSVPITFDAERAAGTVQ